MRHLLLVVLWHQASDSSFVFICGWLPFWFDPDAILYRGGGAGWRYDKKLWARKGACRECNVLHFGRILRTKCECIAFWQYCIKKTTNVYVLHLGRIARTNCECIISAELRERPAEQREPQILYRIGGVGTGYKIVSRQTIHFWCIRCRQHQASNLSCFTLLMH
jgi:hypothetical protein